MSDLTLDSKCNFYEQTIHGDEVEIRMRVPIPSLASKPTAFTDVGELAAMSLVVFTCSNAGALLAALGTMPPHVAAACNALAQAALEAREQLLTEMAKAKEIPL